MGFIMGPVMGLMGPTQSRSAPIRCDFTCDFALILTGMLSCPGHLALCFEFTSEAKFRYFDNDSKNIPFNHLGIITAIPVQKGANRLIDIPIELTATGLEFKINPFSLANQCYQLVIIGGHL